MEPLAVAAVSRFDPAEWEFHIRRSDGSWLARPAPLEGAAPSNAETWTRVLGNSWAFDSARDAHAAAIAHGSDVTAFVIIPAPRDPAAWLSKGRPQPIPAGDPSCAS